MDDLDSTLTGTDASFGDRRLIAVLYADMVGYSRLVGLDIVGTLRRFQIIRSGLIDPAIRDHGGRLVQTGGDSLLLAFDSIDGAVRCAVTIQQEISDFDQPPAPDQAIRFRIGINIGDTIAEGTNLHGDAVNIAARLQAECPPDGICVSRAVRDHMQDQRGLVFRQLGALELKNILRPIEAYLVGVEVYSKRPRRAHTISTTPRRPARSNGPRVATQISEGGFHHRPAVAVMPFVNTSGDPDHAYFSEGIADDIINELASWRIFPIIARNSTFAFKGQNTDIVRIGKKLGARYIVEGNVTKSGLKVRISARLIDASSGIQVAAERFDRSIGDLAELQNQIAEMIVGSIAPELLRAERHRVSQVRWKNASSYECFLRGLDAHYRYTAAENAKAQQLFRKAIKIDPRNAQAHALLASAMLQAVQVGWREDDQHNYIVADQFASRAVALDPRAPFAHFSLGSTSMFLGRIDQALAELRSAVKINPSHAAAYAIMAHLLCYNGEPNLALEAAQTALRLSPYDPRMGFWLSAVAQASYFLGNYDEAAMVGQHAISLIHENPVAQRFAAAGLGQIGRIADAAPIVADLKRSSAPTIEAIRQSVVRLYRVGDMIEHMLAGLLKAGLE